MYLTVIFVIFSKMSTLLKEADCQCTFGVYTKWDEYLKERKEGEGYSKLEDVRAKHEKKYRKCIATDKDDEQQVFFVDVKSVQKVKVSISHQVCCYDLKV